MLLKLVCRMQALKSDRGEGPIPHLIMVALMAVGAFTIAGLILAVQGGWLARIPK